ncbi:hypothetical protein QFC21_000815 [Naganishia friedmannii]|uniref:Uncharacterized protein n=1 Tax=Naganishia friedmannii TaxID=89922 RepID=A0ACC2W6J7_9TREE|nr:hypothetical protein QFC21_000815 [Naganishia friedmannii]
MSSSNTEEELELIRSSLMPEESLQESETTPNQFTITSADSPYRIHFDVADQSKADAATLFQIKTDVMAREEALGWAQWVQEKVDGGWNEAVETGYPFYHMITTHFLPILQTNNVVAEEDVHKEPTLRETNYEPGHLLFTSHHLLSPTKRRLLNSLSSSLHLKGFGKVGYPGIIFAQGDLTDLEDFAKEVKSWQWLALKLRVLEPDKENTEKERQRRGRWEEVTKIGEALEWLRGVGKEYLLTDSGIGVTSADSKK